MTGPDYYGNTVNLHAEDLRHLHEHMEMKGYEYLIFKTVRDPEEIRVSSNPRHGTSAGFKSGPNVGPGAEGIRVLVQYEDHTYRLGTTKGRVTTAYPISVKKFPNPLLGPVVYRRKKP
jgi:hypothetical protein